MITRQSFANSPAAIGRMESSFPNHWHYDPEHHQKELDTFWYSMWIYACRSEDVGSPRDYKVVPVGDQNVVVTRDLKGNVRAFHNTCRHRGSILCTQDEGRFEGGSIVCPYHAWTYSLEGNLIATPHQLESADFDMKDYSLYGVAVGEWGGFVFVNLAGDRAEPLENVLGDFPERFANYRTEDLRLGYRYVAEIKTNWKLWFENYMECFHCPQVHPELCAVVPIYALALDGGFARDWEGTGGDTMVRELDIIPGAKTWTMDGQLSGPALSGLSQHELDSPQNGGMLRPSFFLNMHPDYVHTQRMLPTSPSTVEITWDYLFEPETMEREDFDAKRAYELWHITNLQDAQNVEWQQAGLMAGKNVHKKSLFVSNEQGPWRFNRWVADKLKEAGAI